MSRSGRDQTGPKHGGAPPGQDVERDRLAEALRANLERRKKQKRARLEREAGTETS
jgi:hypothetical protein